MKTCCCCLACVQQAEVGLVETCGRYNRIISPGCHFINCLFGECISGIVTLRIQQLNITCETKTKDNVFVNIVVSVQYRALEDKAYDAFYRLSNPQQQIQSYVFDVVRASVPRLNIDSVFEQKDEIARSVKMELDKEEEEEKVKAEERRRKLKKEEERTAARLRVAATDKAEAEKIAQVKRAEAEAEAKYLSGLGIARQRQAIVDGLRESVLTFSSKVEGTTAKDVLDLVLVTQYFDTMKDIGSHSKNTTVFMPSNPSAVADIASQVRMGFLQGAKALESDAQPSTSMGPPALQLMYGGSTSLSQTTRSNR
ncbi:hypothetical protein CBR_g27947 [Chara braunii]|uniref:Band 7 domain-containing protein n=1 Tax=Chara braunii TaxID=69332 RepID=A0A388L906_CHABU|nr:hypothetical protein CBR_g27947 [Chara braunii]|eukprot:GBG78722.1 hypothetical protein CBR_g27947 [Chara braunii]